MSRSLRPVEGGASRTPEDTARKAAIKKIHARARELDMDDEVRRDLQQRVTGVESCRDMTVGQLDAVLREMGARTSGPRAGGTPALPHARKIRALWLSLWQLGAVHDPSETALDAFVRRQTDVSSLRFLGGRDADVVIEALKDWCDREGFQVPADGLAARRALLWAQWQRLGRLGAVRLVEAEALECWLQHRVVPHRSSVGNLTRPQLDHGIRLLGEWIRRVAGKDARPTGG